MGLRDTVAQSVQPFENDKRHPGSVPKQLTHLWGKLCAKKVRFKDLYKQLGSKGYLKKILTELCLGLHLISKAGLVHCDLKLENIMIDMNQNGPTVKIIDFGSTFHLSRGLPRVVPTFSPRPSLLSTCLQNCLFSSNQALPLHKTSAKSMYGR